MSGEGHGEADPAPHQGQPLRNPRSDCPCLHGLKVPAVPTQLGLDQQDQFSAEMLLVYCRSLQGQLSWVLTSKTSPVKGCSQLTPPEYPGSRVAVATHHPKTPLLGHALATPVACGGGDSFGVTLSPPICCLGGKDELRNSSIATSPELPAGGKHLWFSG